MKFLRSSSLLCCIVLSAFNRIIATRFMPNPCRGGNQVIVNVGSIFSYTSSDILKMDNYYSNTNYCSVRLVQTFKSEGFVISIKNLDIKLGTLTFNDGLKTSVLTGYMSYTEEKFVFASVPGAPLTVTYSGPDDYVRRKFELVYTVYRSSYNCSSSSSIFNCANGRCIASELQCDGHNHCGDRSDQYCHHSVGTIVGSVFGCIVIVLFIIGVIVCLKRRNSQHGITVRPSQPVPAYHIPPPTAQHVVNPMQYQGNQGQTVHLPPPTYVPPKM